MARKKNARAAMREQLEQSTVESHNRRDESGGMQTYFKSGALGDTPTWWAGKGDHIIDIIPYIAGEYNPKSRPGKATYVLEIEVHRFVGPMDNMLVCPGQYGDPCPICEKSNLLNREGADWKTEVKPLKPSKRVMYNIVVRDGGVAEKKGVQIFEIAHWFMEKHISKIAKDPRGGGFTVFSDPDTGKSISFERTGVGAENTDYTGHRFVDRPDPVSDDELDAALCLDELIEIKSYDEIAAIFYGESKPSSEAEEDEVAETENEEPENEEPEVNEPEPEETERERKKRERAERKAAKDTSKSDELVCPAGGTIGEDVDELEHCDDCEIYEECDKIADTL